MCIGPLVPFEKMPVRIETVNKLIEFVGGPEAWRCGLRESDCEIFIDSRPRDFACNKPVSKFKVVKCMEWTPWICQKILLIFVFAGYVCNRTSGPLINLGYVPDIQSGSAGGGEFSI
jgi:hypothetical protein